MAENVEKVILEKMHPYAYPAMAETNGGSVHTVEAGEFTDLGIIVTFGKNGTGKTTFFRLLVGDTVSVDTDKIALAVSLKLQAISHKFLGTVRMLLLKQIKNAFMHP
jgi:ATP-binding cassette, sub-family E, member 1